MNLAAGCAGITYLLVSTAIGVAVSPLRAFRAMTEAAADALDTGRDDKTAGEVGCAAGTGARIYDLGAYRRRATGPGRGVA